MIRIMHTGLVVLFVAAALLGYGAKEETRALGKQIERLESRKTALEAEIALLRAEWDHVTSPRFLLETAARLDGEGAMADAEGATLAAWRPEQLVPLGEKPRPVEMTPDAVASGDIGVATIPTPSTGGAR